MNPYKLIFFGTLLLLIFIYFVKEILEEVGAVGSGVLCNLLPLLHYWATNQQRLRLCWQLWVSQFKTSTPFSSPQLYDYGGIK